MKFKGMFFIILILSILLSAACESKGISSGTRFEKNSGNTAIDGQGGFNGVNSDSGSAGNSGGSLNNGANGNKDGGANKDSLTNNEGASADGGSGYTTETELTMKADLLCLMTAYPGNITNVEREGAEVYAVLKSGKKLLYDDGKTKTRDAAMSKPDIQDMLEQLYPLEPAEELPEKDYDPGRIRIYELLEEVYGESRTQIEQNLIPGGFGWKNLSFNKHNEAAANLKRLMASLTELSKTSTGILNKIFPADGTYNYRIIEGTNRLSPHSFGIAVDLKVNADDYWRWTDRDKGQKRLAAYPAEAVERFEQYGFIWGGKWYHFDIMHYEYRPEIIFKAKYFADNAGEGGLGSDSGSGGGTSGNEDQEVEWYKELTGDIPAALDYAKLIEAALK